MIKRGLDFRAGLTWMRRGTQGHVAAHAGPRDAYAEYLYLYSYSLHIIYSMGIQPSVYQKGIQPLIPPYLLNRNFPLIFTVWD